MTNITACILELRQEYVKNRFASDYQEINSGLCVEFAEDIQGMVQEDCEVISNDVFMNQEKCDGWNGDGKDIWDEGQLADYGTLIPEGFSLNDLTKTIQGYHCWVYGQGKHYDAECPEGVESLFNLPFFKRHLQQKEQKTKRKRSFTDDINKRCID